MTEITASGICENPVKSSGVCGFELPWDLCDFNSMVKKKIEKHTTEPTATFSGEVSFNTSTGFYLGNFEKAREAGSIYIDQRNGYFCTYITPSGCTAIATLYSGSSANQFAVSGYKLPLNSKLHKLHGHYDNLDAEMIYVAAPVDVTVEYPSLAHPNEFRVIQSGSLVAAWNTQVLSGFAGSHLVIK